MPDILSNQDHADARAFLDLLADCIESDESLEVLLGAVRLQREVAVSAAAWRAVIDALAWAYASMGTGWSTRTIHAAPIDFIIRCDVRSDYAERMAVLERAPAMLAD